MVEATLDWTKDLERWLRPFLGRLGHTTRRRMCPAYVSGLIGPGERKSIQPMADLSRPAEDMLGKAQWRRISWRLGTKGKLKARFAALRVRVADGSTQWIRDKSKQHLPGEELWLVGEHRDSGEKKYYLANLPTKTDLRILAATIKARWVCEQAHQQLKEEIGLDHFEGRRWQGLHRHALMTMIAYAFLQHRRLATAKRKKNRRPAPANPARRTSRHSRTLRPATAATVSTLPKIDMQRATA